MARSLTTEIQLCNRALSHLGINKTITSLTASNPRAEQCNLLYAPSRDCTLEAFDWEFARKKEVLSFYATDEYPEWDYCYLVPEDCLAERRIYNANTEKLDSKERYQIVSSYGEERLILTDIADAWIHYTKQITDVKLFSMTFCNALAWQLASELALPLTGDPDKAKFCLQMTQMVIGQAKLSTVQKDQSVPETRSRYTRGRR